ncbi:unnamed protein product [Caenorhabditis angaria]|uniref:Uncharacterized protein n=1 Tax=Caenorhabditis angaria TaxID=860376 RepID=A0A9P1IQ58_9PELO|nr:unnamed protein product [Caenorhabditis angaria]
MTKYNYWIQESLKIVKNSRFYRFFIGFWRVLTTCKRIGAKFHDFQIQIQNFCGFPLIIRLQLLNILLADGCGLIFSRFCPEKIRFFISDQPNALQGQQFGYGKLAVIKCAPLDNQINGYGKLAAIKCAPLDNQINGYG